ncbi:CDK5 and ABL1 enzyme substrate 2 [Clonorchis sinensis]|uniref:CDK5 and ABL1 enzyme substrate 2 n=1 Tax=Clonorchis sinensis TaxID=79923 RepID=G7YKF4_CLOSI|nr:CDK5 and ABL1 enzyme substrate 2 [Clonorchis sinensis]
MKRKKSRHKLLAVDFLSNISFDGHYPTRVPVNGKVDSGLLSLEEESTSGKHSVGPDSTTCTKQTKQSTESCRDGHGSQQFVEAHQIQRFSNGKVVGAYTRQADLNEAAESAPRPPGRGSISSVVSGDTVQHASLEFFECRPPSVFPASQARTTVRCRPNGVHRGLDHRALWSDLQSRRLAICPKGFPKTVLTVFSVICHKKSVGRGRRSSAIHYRNSVDSDINPTVALAASSQAKHSSASTSTRDHTSSLIGSDPVRSLSSFRPTDDEVLSFAAFLHPRPNYWTPTGSGFPVLGGRNFTATIKEVDCFLSTSTDSHSLPTGAMTEYPLSSVWHAATPAVVASATGYRHGSAIGNYLPSRRTHLINPWSRPARQRNPSGTSISSANAVNAIIYPDPLTWYSPLLLDDPDLLVATGKQVFQLPNYLTSVLIYTRPTEQKRDVNREFHERFPLIQLTLTKLRSIKALLVHITRKLSFDLWIAAHAHVLFEKLILKLFVNKQNRRLCASASLLISAKLNDVKGSDLNTLFMELENNFRISRRDLIHAELDVALGLEFCLIPSESEILVHCSRIYKNLDLPQPYSVRCFAPPSIPLQSRATESL